MNLRQAVSLGLAGLTVFAIRVSAAPAALPNPLVNTACPAGPTIVNGVPDTVVSTPDSNGFYSLFDGKDLKGWWESCQTPHSSLDPTYGGVWGVDSTIQSMYSEQNPNGAGSILMTNNKYGNYELTMDYWPDFANDGGVFNRTTANGVCYQATMDYITASSVGGAYFENGYAGGAARRYHPYNFGANKATITITTGGGTNGPDWTTITRTLGNPTSYGCPTTGCTPTQWLALWDTGGWNQFRVKFYGAGTSAKNMVHNFTWFRKFGAAAWVPVLFDSVQYNTPASYIGLQIHGTTARWTGLKGSWYRNIKLRPLDSLGNPIPQVVAIEPAVKARYDVRATSEALTGTLGTAHQITISDMSGRVLERFSGPAGTFYHAFHTKARGWLIVQVKTVFGTDRFRVNRVSQ